MGHSFKLYTGQIVGLNATPQSLDPSTLLPSIREVVVQADPDNTTDVLIGHSTNQFLKLVPGQGMSVPINNLYSIYVKMESATTGTVSWLARD